MDQQAVKIKVICFGMAREIFETSLYETDLSSCTVAELKLSLAAAKPDISKLGSYMIAVNQSYATDDQLISAHDEVAIIPPVSGG